MEFRRVGKSGLQVTRLGYGSWLSVGSARVSHSSTAAALIDSAFTMGIRFFDTADVYVGGKAERLLGQSLARRERATYVISSKAFFPIGAEPLQRGLSRKHIVESVTGSRSRLGTYIDIFFCHRFDEEAPLRETLYAIAMLLDQGAILYWATSEWPIDRLAEACEMCDKFGWPPPIADQFELNILNYAKRQSRIDHLRKLGIGVISWSPLCGGLLSGKYNCSIPVDSRFGTFKSISAKAVTNDHLTKARAFVAVADQSGVKPAPLAIAWLLADERIDSVILGSTSVGQLQENMSALDCEVFSDHWASVSALIQRWESTKKT